MTMSDEFGEVLLQTQHKNSSAKLFRDGDIYHILQARNGDREGVATVNLNNLTLVATKMASGKEYDANKELGQLILDNIEDL